MSNDFKVEISTQFGLNEEDILYDDYDSDKSNKNATIISVCLTCINKECLNIIEEIKKDPDFFDDEICLIRIRLTIFKDNHIYKYDNKNIYFKAYLNDFYNNITKYGKGISYLSQKLKGGAKAMFALLLLKATQSNVLDNNDIILLEASGDENENENMLGLIHYYEKLGFSILNKKNLETQLEEQSVMMFGKVESVIRNSSNMNYINISEELKSILNQF
jgi:hypothetical protein